MPENEKPKLSGELLHQLLGEYVEKAGHALRRYEQGRFKLLGSLCILGVIVMAVLSVNYILARNYFSFMAFVIGLIALAGGLLVSALRNGNNVVKEDLALSFWQLRRIYELASRYEDTGLDLEPALRTGIVLKLGEAQLLLSQLAKFESKDARFEEMRSLGPDPLKIQARPEETRTKVPAGLATTER
ncbi:hypothetical protein ACNOYE_08235 [Nannocystaceae bacterium ST9]